MPFASMPCLSNNWLFLPIKDLYMIGMTLTNDWAGVLSIVVET